MCHQQVGRSGDMSNFSIACGMLRATHDHVRYGPGQLPMLPLLVQHQCSAGYAAAEPAGSALLHVWRPRDSQGLCIAYGPLKSLMGLCLPPCSEPGGIHRAGDHGVLRWHRAAAGDSRRRRRQEGRPELHTGEFPLQRRSQHFRVSLPALAIGSGASVSSATSTALAGRRPSWCIPSALHD